MAICLFWSLNVFNHNPGRVQRLLLSSFMLHRQPRSITRAFDNQAFSRTCIPLGLCFIALSSFKEAFIRPATLVWGRGVTRRLRRGLASLEVCVLPIVLLVLHGGAVHGGRARTRKKGGLACKSASYILYMQTIWFQRAHLRLTAYSNVCEPCSRRSNANP